MKSMIIKVSIVLAVSLLLIFLFCYGKTKQHDTEVNEVEMIEITLLGEVTFPGVYESVAGIMLSEIVEYAHGFTKNANVQKVNLSATYVKNAVVSIPKLEESVTTERINVNYASFVELQTIPGITEKIALQILIYREEHGFFNELKELLNVKYIGEKTFEKIMPHIYI